jgi:prolipoprotein diacylglyceryltransferase
MLPTIQLGPVSLQVPGLVLLAGLWIGLTFSERRARRHGEDPSFLYNLVFIALIAGLVGARLAYVLTYPDAFTANPWSLVSINQGLMDPFAGAIIAIAAGTVYLTRRQQGLWVTLDGLTPLFSVMAVTVGISHLASGSAFGKPTDLPIGIQLWGESRHPSQVYEIILAIIILVAVYYLDRSSSSKIPGFLFLAFASMTAASRLLLEAFRGDSILILGGFRTGQLISWLVLALCMLLIFRRLKTQGSVEEPLL